jgi:hypothetical protein
MLRLLWRLVTYLRLLDADAEGADWQEVAKKSSCTSTLNANPTALSVPGRPIWTMRSG